MFSGLLQEFDILIVCLVIWC